MPNEIETSCLPPSPHLQLATRVQFAAGARREHFTTPLVEDEDDFDARCEGRFMIAVYPGVNTTVLVVSSPPASLREALRAGPLG
jgi:hypothetical protein